MSEDAPISTNAAEPLAPWLQVQLAGLLKQRGHAWLLTGPSGLGQFELALALARAWLCESPTPQGACGHCGSCHAVDVHTHADLCMLMPETLSLALGWPLDEKTQDDLDAKKRKPSKEIKVDAARQAVTFTQFTRSRGATKVVMVYPAERMNGITANTLLKTLEEPPGEVRFILATEAAQQLLPTIRSRCQSHALSWPDAAECLAWLQSQSDVLVATTKNAKPASPADLQVLLAAMGGRPADALDCLRQGSAADFAKRWQALPQAVARGDMSVLADWAPPQVVDALQKLCHDVWAVKVGAQPRFFAEQDLPKAAARTDTRSGPTGISTSGHTASPSGPSLYALSAWSRDLAASARTVEHPYNPGLMLEALVSRAQTALRSR